MNPVTPADELGTPLSPDERRIAMRMGLDDEDDEPISTPGPFGVIYTGFLK